MKPIRNLLNRLGDVGPFQVITRSFRNKLLLLFLALTLIPLTVLGLISYFSAVNALNEDAFSAVESINTLKASEIETYFLSVRTSMDDLVDTVDNLNKAALDKFEVINNLKKAGLQRLFTEWQDDVLDVSSDPGVVAGMQDLLAGYRSVGSIQVRSLYLDKPTLENARDGSDYSAAHFEQQSFFSGYNNIHGYLDAFLIDLDGNVIYTTQKGDSFGTNLVAGPYQLSSLADLYLQLKDAPVGQTYIADITPFEDGSQAMFIGTPIYNGTTRVGILAYRLSFEKINEIVQNRAGFSETAESYLVGKYKDSSTYRSVRVVKEGQVGDPRTGPEIEKALQGIRGQIFKIGSTGAVELATATPLELPDVNWMINSTVSLNEAVAPILPGETEDFYTQFIRDAGYPDLYLLNAEGFIIYSVNEGPEFQTNILSGPYQDSLLAREVAEIVFNEGRASEEEQFFLGDFGPYAPADGAVSAFAARPIYDAEGALSLIVALRIAPDDLNAITQVRAGQNQTEETYLVGPDNLFRNDSRFLEQLGVESTIMNENIPVDTVAVRSALAGGSGTENIADYRGVSVLSTWRPLSIDAPGAADPESLIWAIITEIDEAEVNQPAVTLAQIVAGLGAGIAILAVLVSVLFTRAVTRQTDTITHVFSDIGIGDFDSRAEVISRDELGQMATGLNAMLDNTLALIQTQEERDALQISILKLLEEVSGVAEGDLTIEAEVTADATGAIADSFNFMIEQLRTVISQVQDATLQVSSSANQIQTTAEHLSQGSESQAAQIVDTSAAMDEMAVSIQQVSENATQSAAVAEQALLNAKQGAQAVQDTIEGMNRIRGQVQETAKRITRLGESSQQIGEIVQLIGDIADRTSILALNASIQAAMAGEAGRGFAVVAEEVESLAVRATEATNQIANLVKTIQSETNETVTAMEESTEEVVRGSEVANQAGQALNEIENVSTRLAELIQSISLASKQQARGSEAVAQSMGDIANVTQQTAAGTKEAAVSINTLAVLADTLRGSVSAFKLPNGTNGQGH